MNWSFCSSLAEDEQDIVFGYTMKFIPDGDEVYLEWTHKGNRCNGRFQSQSGVMTLNCLTKSSTVMVVYRIMHDDVMAAVVTEVDGNNDPSLQYGNIYRLNEENY